jgi:hypothetical protein
MLKYSDIINHAENDQTMIKLLLFSYLKRHPNSKRISFDNSPNIVRLLVYKYADTVNNTLFPVKGYVSMISDPTIFELYKRKSNRIVGSLSDSASCPRNTALCHTQGS